VCVLYHLRSSNREYLVLLVLLVRLINARIWERFRFPTPVIAETSESPRYLSSLESAIVMPSKMRKKNLSIRDPACASVPRLVANKLRLQDGERESSPRSMLDEQEKYCPETRQR